MWNIWGEKQGTWNEGEQIGVENPLKGKMQQTDVEDLNPVRYEN